VNKKVTWEPYVLVDKHLEPILPCDCNEHQDQGMLVYRSRGAARVAAKHQLATFNVACKAVPLSTVIAHEANTRAFAKKAALRVEQKLKLNRACGIR